MTAPQSARIPTVNLRRLYYFTVLAEELHFGRAAARLHLAQPGLSQQIKTLETELGVVLLERGRRETRLTPAGQVLQQEAEPLLRDAREMVEQVHARAKGYTSQLRVAYTRSATYLGTTESVHEFRELHPDVHVRSTEAWTALNVAMLRAREVDVAFVRPPIYEPDIEVVILLEEELVLALPSGHPLIEKPTIVPEDVRDEGVVLWPREFGPGYYDRIVSQIWGTGRANIVVEEPDDGQILAAVARGRGIAIVELHRAVRIRPHGVELRQFADPPPTSALGIAWLARDRTPTVEAFVAVCRGICPPPVSI